MNINLDWMASFSSLSMRATFVACGLLLDKFNMDTINRPLKDLLKGEYSIKSWATIHVELLIGEESNKAYAPSMWHFPEVNVLRHV